MMSIPQFGSFHGISVACHGTVMELLPSYGTATEADVSFLQFGSFHGISVACHGTVMELLPSYGTATEAHVSFKKIPWHVP